MPTKSKTKEIVPAAAKEVVPLFKRALANAREDVQDNTYLTEPLKLGRLRSLGNVVGEKVSARFSDRAFLDALADPEAEHEFIRLLDKHA